MWEGVGVDVGANYEKLAFLTCADFSASQVCFISGFRMPLQCIPSSRPRSECRFALLTLIGMFDIKQMNFLNRL